MKLKAVMDTNVLISGILWRGIPFELLRWAEKGYLIIYTSLEILAEVNRVLNYSKFQKYIDSEESSPMELFEKIASLCTIIYPDQEVKNICSDKDDQIFLSCALAAKAGALISGDKHLLNIKQYKSVRILTTREFYIENVRKIS